MRLALGLLAATLACTHMGVVAALGVDSALLEAISAFPALTEEDLQLLDTVDTMNATLVINGSWMQVAVRGSGTLALRTPPLLTAQWSWCGRGVAIAV
jgi:hypothetical protein